MDYPISVPSVGLVDGKFVDENPLTGTPGSLIPAQWGNSVTQELLNVIQAGGLSPNELDNAQVLLAIRNIIQGAESRILADTGTAGSYSAVNAIPLTAQPTTGFIQRVRIANPNTGAATYAPDGIAARPIYGLGLQPLQGGELPAGVAVFMYLAQAGINGGNGAWILIESLGGAAQIAPATKSNHALPLGQATGRLLNIQVFRTPGTFTYTKTPGTTACLIEASGAGASGAGTPVTGSGQCAIGGPGGSGAYASAWFSGGIANGTSIVVGTGGVPVNGGGSNGGVTSVGSVISCPGGRTGSTAGPSAPPLSTGGGAGATGSASVTGGTSININSGRAGGLTIAMALSGTSLGGAPGADGQWGGGGTAVAGNVPGNPANAPGAGGSGAVTNASQASISGGAGGNGIVIFYEYGSA